MSAKTVLRNSIARILFLSGLTAPKNRGRDRLSIATFHRVLPEKDRRAYPFPGLAVTPEELDNFLDYFTEHFDCGDLATQHQRYMSGEATTRPLLAITFDDAQFDNFQYAWPVLKRHQVKASFYVPVVAVEKRELLWHDRLGFAVLALLNQDRDGRARLIELLKAVGMNANDMNITAGEIVEASKRLTLQARLSLVEALDKFSGFISAPEFARLMTYDEISELAREGHEIGSHSMTHCLMPECDDQALAYEVTVSRQALQAAIGQPINSFCYPNGNADARTAQAVKQAGYLQAVTTTWGSNGRDANPFLLHRCDMASRRVQDSTGKFVPALLAFRMSGFYPGLG